MVAAAKHSIEATPSGKEAVKGVLAPVAVGSCVVFRPRCAKLGVSGDDSGDDGTSPDVLSMTQAALPLAADVRIREETRWEVCFFPPRPKIA